MRATVLVVDDDPSIRNSLARMLHVHGYHAVCAGDGAEAISKALSASPQVVLVDLHMPGHSGLEITRQLRAHDSLRNVPIVALSASPALGVESAALFHRVLAKPCSTAELLRVLESALSR